MRQVIKGLVYNTETAEILGSADSSYLGANDFRSYSETLFKTKKGRFFLAGEGGPMTKWGEACGDMRGFGSGIIPLDSAEAREWCEFNDIDIEVISEHFDLEDA